jgi:beta-glucanase (GH16 family)
MGHVPDCCRQGITGNYDRGSFFSVPSPQTQFHTYTVDWTPTALTWSVDGTVVRTFSASDADSGTHQYPQTPAKLQLGIWAGGDPGNAWGKQRHEQALGGWLTFVRYR